MRERILLWMMDAPRTYADARACLKKEISPQSIATYLSRIDQWYTELTDQSQGTLSRYPSISRMQHFLNGSFKCRDQQVHGITFEVLEKIVAAASRHEIDVARMRTAAYTLAFYAMLRPTDTKAQHVRRDQAHARLRRHLLQRIRQTHQNKQHQA